MTPGARVAAAIEVLDAIFDGQTTERALTSWGRSHRFAGSKDRAAIRDHVFGALRCKLSYGWLGGADTGRGVMLGAARAIDQEQVLFSGEGHAPPPATPQEAGAPLDTAPRHVQCDIPEWMLDQFDAALGPDADTAMAALRDRAGVFLRVNSAKATVAEATSALAEDGIIADPVSGVKNALQIVENERRLAQSNAYKSGLVEVQDPSSQLAVEALDVTQGDRALDYCAGGGGKALALAARGSTVFAHDIEPARMADIPERAARAGTAITVLSAEELDSYGPFDIVFCDAPCSGSGTWRRSPQAKWALTPERLEELEDMQRSVLQSAQAYVRPGGCLIYATCSVFEAENGDQCDGFLQAYPAFEEVERRLIAPHAQGDGFFFAVLRRSA